MREVDFSEAILAWRWPEIKPHLRDDLISQMQLAQFGQYRAPESEPSGVTFQNWTTRSWKGVTNVFPNVSMIIINHFRAATGKAPGPSRMNGPRKSLGTD